MKCFRSLFIYSLLLVPVTLFAGKLEKGFEKLNMHDYFSAKGFFEKSMGGDPAAAAYGLARIFSVNNNPFYSTDSARKYIVLSDSLYSIQKERVKRYYRELGVTDTTIRELSELICNDAFINAENSGTSEAFNHFIRTYNSCAQTEEVIELRNDAAYSEAEKQNTSEAFKNFMASYPNSLQFDDAHKKYDGLIYSENTDGTIESYHFFLQNFPESPYRKQAAKMIYNLSVPDKSIEQYAAFVRKYPNSPYYKDAWYEVYKLGMVNFSEATYTDFKSKYPDYPFPDELETDYRLQNTFFIPYMVDDLWGFINDTGEVMISPKFEEVSMFSEGLSVTAINGKYGYINKTGKVIIDYLFEDAEPFHNNAAIVMKDSLYGLIDKSGDFLIPPGFEELAEANQEIYMAVKNEQSGYVLRSGDSLTSFIFEVANDFKNGYAIVSEKEKLGLIDSTGKSILSAAYEDLVFINDRFLKAMNDEDLWGIVTINGDTVLPFDYDAIGEYSDGRALIAKNGKCGFIDEARTEIIPPTYLYSSLMLTTGKFENGFALLKQKYKSILIDTAGTIVKFKGAEDYGRPSEGFFPVRKNARWGFSDATGKIVIPCKYHSVDPFSGGLAIIRLNKFHGVIDYSGNEVIPAQFDAIFIADKSIIVKNDAGNGLFSRDGALIIPPEFENIEFLRPDIVKASGKSGYQFINLDSGKIIYSTEN